MPRRPDSELSAETADKVARFRELSPRFSRTGSDAEEQLKNILLSLSGTELFRFKFVLDHDHDSKDMVEYVFHDIDERKRQDVIVRHFATQSAKPLGIKVLTDVDDTMKPTLLDQRYPNKNRYPGVEAFYAALGREPFQVDGIPIVTLSARPAFFEEGSLNDLAAGSQLRPSGLSGELKSGLFGTFQSFLRAKLPRFADLVPDHEEQEIALFKYKNFRAYADVYPEYRYVFLGDTGQADALAAGLMLQEGQPSQRVIATFIHDIRRDAADGGRASRSFHRVPDEFKVTRDSAISRGIVVHRNYIEAAVIAHLRLGDLIDAPKLLAVTKAAVAEYAPIAAQTAPTLRQQYRAAAEEACTLLEKANIGADVAAIRQQITNF